MISGCCFLRSHRDIFVIRESPDKVSDNALIVIEMFVVLIYDRTNEFSLSGRTNLGASNTEGPKAPKSCKVRMEKKVSIWKTLLDKSGMNYELIHCKCSKAFKC